ncbi:MAG: hypothetical protein AAF488_17885 [Planctomycetota bacterium]
MGIRVGSALLLACAIASGGERTIRYKGADGIAFEASWPLYKTLESEEPVLFAREGLVRVNTVTRLPGMKPIEVPHLLKTIVRVIRVETGASPHEYVRREHRRLSEERRLDHFAEEPVAFIGSETDVSDKRKRIAVVSAYREFDGALFAVEVTAVAEHFPALRPEFLRIARSLTRAGAPYPRVSTDGYRTPDGGGGLTWKLHPELDTTEAISAMSCADAVQKRFQAIYGKIQPRAARRVHILVVPEGHDTSSPVATISNYPWIVTKPLDAERKRAFIRQLNRALFFARFGSAYPNWILEGDDFWAVVDVESGTAPHKLPETVPIAIPASIVTVKKLHDSEFRRRPDQYAANAQIWVGFLTRGPSRYRGIYKRFWKDAAKAGRVDSALDKHILPLTVPKVQKALIRWVDKKLRPLK